MMKGVQSYGKSGKCSNIYDKGMTEKNALRTAIYPQPSHYSGTYSGQDSTLETNQHNAKQEESRSAEAGSTCCRAFLTFLFSNVGLSLLVVAYTIAGGFIFEQLEAPNEIRKRHYVTYRREQLVTEVWTYVENNKMVLNRDNLTDKVEKLFEEYQNVVLEAQKDGWNGADDKVEYPLQWSYAGALLYSVTVITTIGYGNIAPKTSYGQLVTMFYALFGIPLNFLYLANIGRFLGNVFRLFCLQLSRLWLWIWRKRSNRVSDQNTAVKNIKPSKLGPKQNEALPWVTDATSSNSVTFLSRTHTVFTSRRSRSLEDLSPQFASKSGVKDLNKSEKIHSKQMDKMDISQDTHYADLPNNNLSSQNQTKAKTEEIHVPTTVCFIVVALYVFGGALMFSKWEGWTYLEASYYCFITLSTIGFGDYVPGSFTNTDAEDSRKKLVICCLYVMFGLAVLAMCFDLVQEDVRAKFKTLGRKIGLID